ncbi:hypothetical protein PV703_04100 [Streptomyces sp. ME01-24h]|nr:hypothetical protein [Streptomyces sp. ME19-03-3]MDX3352518.1 hypothetical protein [Streptomyces sp. ME01-24h]
MAGVDGEEVLTRAYHLGDASRRFMAQGAVDDQRRPQLVRRVGDEPSLVGEGLVEPVRHPAE